jgi:uncharacterized protein involved in type VI secretion and phage assembly
MDRVYGVVTALVTDVKDPEEMGRIRLSYPWLAAEGTDSGWAPIVRPMAGKDRGFHYLPEVDDEALVAFEHGMVDHPMVIGFLHNGEDLPPHDGIDEHVRRLKSVSGHVLELDDRSGKESIRLHTPKGHQLELHDPNAAIELHTAGGHKVRLQDSPGRIQLATNGGTKVTLDDSPSQVELTTTTGVTITISDTGGVSVTAPTSSVTVTTGLGASVTAGTSADVTAPAMTLSAAMLSVNAAMATFSGVLQCQTLISTSVVSSSYTPGVGNIW